MKVIQFIALIREWMATEPSDNIEITEEEFRKIREEYERSLIELEWQELKGYDI